MGSTVASLQTDYLAIEMLKVGYLLPWNKDKNAKRNTYEGGKNFHRNGRFTDVYNLDVQAMYPNNAVNCNISPETFKSFESSEEITYEYNEPQHSRTETEIWAYLKDDKLKILGSVVIDTNEGVLIKIIKYFMHLKDTTDKHLFKGKRDGYKLIINTFYGLLGNGGGRMNSTLFAALITYQAGVVLRNSMEFIRQTLSISNEVDPICFGNTDSVFTSLVNVKGYDSTKSIHENHDFLK